MWKYIDVKIIVSIQNAFIKIKGINFVSFRVHKRYQRLVD